MKVVKIMNGTYNVTLVTPFGPKKGTVVFTDRNGVLNGSIHAMGDTSNFRNGKADGNTFKFSGVFNAGFFNVQYTAKGAIEGNALKGTVNTNLGTFEMYGVKA